ncbi:DUF3313 domain-containing protein [Mesorhizobium sp. CN2-181]|uniref:DUF3313 domain-containing protein n=1 Tax=Mesorhizobium yinganensis TaxID=3157707 RepID=UPI0032B81397
MCTKSLPIFFCFLGLAGCQTIEPVRYTGLTSSSSLKPNAGSNARRMPYSYKADVDWAAYTSAIVEPVTIYRGPDHQFGKLLEADRKTLAGYMQTRFRESLGRKFRLTDRAAPNTLRIKPVLTGATTNTPVLSTFSRFDVAGAVYNGVQSARGGEGSFTGAVMYAVEIYDASTDRLLHAFVAKQYPNAYDISASTGALAAAKAGIDKGAEELLTQLR